MDAKLISKLKAMEARHNVIKHLYADPETSAAAGRFIAGAIKANEELAEALSAKPEKRDPKVAAKLKVLMGLVDDARNGDNNARVELNALRTQTINNYVRANSNWLMFWRSVTLADDEAPEFEYTYKEEVKVFIGGQDGGRRRFKVARDYQKVTVDLYTLKTETPEYPTRDLYRGSAGLRELARAQYDLGWSMMNKVDRVLFAQMASVAFAAFTTTGNKLSRTYNVSDNVVTANLPGTNVLTPDDGLNSGSTKFRESAVRTLATYFASWGGATIDPIGATGAILVPSSEATHLMHEFKPSTTAQNNAGQDVVAQPFTIDWGRRWTIIPDVTLALGTCYPVPSQPIGEVYFKPSQDRVKTKESEDDPDREWQEASKVIGHAIPEPWRPRVCKLTYHT